MRGYKKYGLRAVVNESESAPNVPAAAEDLEAANATFSAHYDATPSTSIVRDYVRNKPVIDSSKYPASCVNESMRKSQTIQRTGM